MAVRPWSVLARATLGALVFASASPGVTHAGAAAKQPLDASSAALVQTSPFTSDLDMTVDLCDDDGATAWGLEEARLDVERDRLGIDCGHGPIVGRIDLYGESTVAVDSIPIPAPPSAPVESRDEDLDTPSAGAPVGFFDTLLGYYSTAAPTPLPTSDEDEISLGGVIVVAQSVRVDDAGIVRGLVRNDSTQLARAVTVSLGAATTVLPVSLQPGEQVGFSLPAPAQRRDLAASVTVEAALSNEADFGRAVALSERYTSSPEQPELLVTTAVPDNVDVPEELVGGFAIVDVTAVVTSLDERGRVLDVSTVALVGDLGFGPEELAETDRIDPSAGTQLLRASTPGAAAVIVNIGGTPIVQPAPTTDREDLVAAAPAAYSSLAVTRGTYRGVMAGIDTLFDKGYGCAAVSKPRLGSVLFAIPAHELAGWQSPSPASFSRGDNTAVDPRNERLYSFGRNNGRAERAFWAPGIGLYQLDTLNLRVGAYAKSNTKRATMLVGKLLLDHWCNGGTTTMRTFLSNTWFGCANDVCFQTAEALYDRAGDRIRNVTKTPGYSVTGGVKNRFCWSPDRPNVYVRCRYFDISRLQGNMNMIAPDGGAGPNPYTPLPADFVELTITTAKGRSEARVFMSGNTGYGREIWAIRPLGTNPRTSLRWYSQTWRSFKKDLSVWSCRQLSDTRERCSWSTTRAR